MTEKDVSRNFESKELDESQAADVAGGSLCSPEDLVSLTSSLTQSYDNLVDFASHVIERVADGIR